jgi:ubiquinone biosynthesis protein UbiJ
VTDALEEIRSRLQEAVAALRASGGEADVALALIEDCARLATEVAAQVDGQVRAALEPLPDLPGQLPLPATI